MMVFLLRDEQLASMSEDRSMDRDPPYIPGCFPALPISYMKGDIQMSYVPLGRFVPG